MLEVAMEPPELARSLTRVAMCSPPSASPPLSSPALPSWTLAPDGLWKGMELGPFLLGQGREIQRQPLEFSVCK